MHADTIAAGHFMLQSIRANAYVFRIRRQQVVSHSLQARWAEDRKRRAPAHHPRCQNQIRVAQRVIAVQMCDEKRLWTVDGQVRRAHAPHHARARVEQKHAPVDNHGGRRPRS